MMPEYAPLLYYAGLLSEGERERMGAMFAKAAALYDSGANLDAFKAAHPLYCLDSTD